MPDDPKTPPRDDAAQGKPNAMIQSEKLFDEALRDIRLILNSVHADATRGERIVRIAWVIGRLPEGLRESVIAEAQNRVVTGWAAGKSPTDW